MSRRPLNALSTAVLLVAAAARAQVGTQSPVPDNPYTPPACVAGVPFADVTCTTPYDAWIEQFAADSITGGCGNGDYCPTLAVTRNQMAVFIERAMRGTANWSPGDAGNYNTFLGAVAGYDTTAGGGHDNTAVGWAALYTNASGYDNVAIGEEALDLNSTGYGSTAVGFDALLFATNNFNTAVGSNAGATITTGYGNTFLGAGADAAANNLYDATAIGLNAVADASYHIRIGSTAITQIGGNVAWSNLSDARAKKEIRPLDLGLDFVMALRPVSFQLIEGDGRTDMGFVAQDVETLLGEDYNVLGIGADADRTLSLRYTDFIAPLVKAIQEQQATISAQQSAIGELQSTVRALTQQVAILRQAAAKTTQ